MLWRLLEIVLFPIHYLLKPEPLPILGVYSVSAKWYWLKFYLMKWVISLRQWRAKRSSQKADLTAGGQFGGSGKRSIEDMESKHVFDGEKTFAADAVFFDGSNADGYYLTLGTAQRQSDIINLFFILRTPDRGTWVNEELLTDTNVQSLPSKDSWTTASGWSVTCVKPMRVWRLQFRGKLLRSPGAKVFASNGAEKVAEPADSCDAEIDLEWTNFGEHFDFDEECSAEGIARALAREPWSRALFDRLRASHQTHYEQFGWLQGKVRLGDEELPPNWKLCSMRDHTITPYRRWSDIRRYIMMIYHLEDGTCIHTSLVSMPGVVFSHLVFGYVVTPDKVKHAVDELDVDLVDLGEDKRHFPRKFRYSFRAGTRNYSVTVEIVETVSFKMGLDLACQVNENMCRFRTDDGRNGRGFVEAEYRVEPY